MSSLLCLCHAPPIDELKSDRLLGQFRAAAANEADTWIEASVFQARLTHSVSAAAELEELRWLAPGDMLPDTLAPLLREHVLPLLWPAAQ